MERKGGILCSCEKKNPKDASPPHMDRSSVFARWRQCTPHGVHSPCNARLPGPTRICPQTSSRSVQMFCRVHLCAKHTGTQTDRQTDHGTCNMCSLGRHHAMHTMRPVTDTDLLIALYWSVWCNRSAVCVLVFL